MNHFYAVAMMAAFMPLFLVIVRPYKLKNIFLILAGWFYFYHIFAIAGGWPHFGTTLFSRHFAHWYGAALSGLGVIWIIAALAVFGSEKKPLTLKTKGVYAINRNPFYTGILFTMAGAFITFANWIFLAYFIVAVPLITYLIKKEEKSLKEDFGDEYINYCKRVRRYF